MQIVDTLGMSFDFAPLAWIVNKIEDAAVQIWLGSVMNEYLDRSAVGSRIPQGMIDSNSVYLSLGLNGLVELRPTNSMGGYAPMVTISVRRTTTTTTTTTSTSTTSTSTTKTTTTTTTSSTSTTTSTGTTSTSSTPAAALMETTSIAELRTVTETTLIPTCLPVQATVLPSGGTANEANAQQAVMMNVAFGGAGIGIGVLLTIGSIAIYRVLQRKKPNAAPLSPINQGPTAIAGSGLVREQIDEIAAELEKPDRGKLLPIVISSSRGMGKTFLLQKLAFNQLERSGVEGKILPLENALRCGRLCAHVPNLPPETATPTLYASAIVVKHVLDSFRGSTVAAISFDLTVAFENLLDPNVEDHFKHNHRLQTLIRSMLLNPEDAFSEWLRLTKVAFGLSEEESKSIRPVILIDEMQILSMETGLPSSTGARYTFLAEVLTFVRASASKAFVICAGTNHGTLTLLKQYSAIIPTNIRLTPLSLEDAKHHRMDCVTKLKMEARIQLGSADDIANVDSCIYWQSHGIPRLLSIGFDAWIQKALGGRLSTAFRLVNFQAEAAQYYKEALDIFDDDSPYSAKDLAMILLCCHVHYRVPKVESCVPGTRIQWTTLINASVVFPANDCCFSMPSVLWPLPDTRKKLRSDSRSERGDTKYGLAKSPSTLPRKYNECCDRLSRMIPGFDLRDLQVDFDDYYSYRNGILTFHGHNFERMFVSSLAVRYYLASCMKKSCASVPFSEVYDYEPDSMLGEALNHWNFQVNLKDGIVCGAIPVDTDSKLSKNAIYLNQKTTNAHRDAVIPAKQKPIAVSCKFSGIFSDAQTVEKQLTTKNDKESVLFWVSLAGKDTDMDGPQGYQSDAIKSAIETHRLMFLSGAGCISPVLMELLMMVKDCKDKKKKKTGNKKTADDKEAKKAATKRKTSGDKSGVNSFKKAKK